MKEKSDLKNFLSRKIEAPKNEECRPGVEGFGDALAGTVLELSESPGNFQDSLAAVMDKRLELALQGNDFETIKTLMLFPETRAKGVSQSGMHGESITGVAEKGTYSLLYKKLVSGYFQKIEEGEKDVVIYKKSYPLPEGKEWIQKMEFFLKDKKIHIHHAKNSEVPFLLFYLQELWEQALKSKSQEVAAKAIAQFEWWFIAPNITGNAGASIGNCLSLVLQTYHNLSLKKEFEHIDWNVLSMSLDDYILFRCLNCESFF